MTTIVAVTPQRTRPTPHRPAQLPALVTLQSKRRWLCWQYEADANGKKPRKAPYNAARPEQKASTSNPQTWSDYQTAVAAQQRYGFDGVGFVAGDGISFVDLDNCLDESGQPNDEARRIVAALDSYTEVSPSGKGLKILVYGSVPDNIGSGATVEIYSAGQYTTITSKHLTGTPTSIRPAQAALEALYALYRHAKRQDIPQPHEHIDWPDADVRRYSKHLALLLDKDGIPARLAAHSQARLALTDLPQLLADKPWLAKWLARTGNDTNASMQRAIVAHGLRTYAGYDFAPFAALLWHLFADKPEHNTRAGRNNRWWRGEIIRLWHDARPAVKAIYAVKLPDDTPAAALPTPAAAPTKATAKRGRPAKIASASAYLDWLKSQADAHTNVVMRSTNEIAALLGVSRRTVQNYEAKLRRDGAIERRAYANRQAGCVFILDFERGAINTTAPAQDAQNDAISAPTYVVKADATIARPDAANSELNAHDKDTRGYLARRVAEPATQDAGQPSTSDSSASAAQQTPRVSLHADSTADSDDWHGVMQSAAEWLKAERTKLEATNAPAWLIAKAEQQLAVAQSDSTSNTEQRGAHQSAAAATTAPGWIIGSSGSPAARKFYGWHQATNRYTDWYSTRADAIAATHKLAQQRAGTAPDAPPEPTAPVAPDTPLAQQALFDLPLPRSSRNAIAAIAA